MKLDAYIGFILDRSGSMGSVKQDIIGGFNRLLVEQKAVPGTCAMTLVQFDNEYEIVCDGKDIREAKPLTDETYVPRGTTALLDAMGRTINNIGRDLAAMPEHDRPGRVVVVVVTDGHENASREFSRRQVFEMVTHQTEKYGWQFVFLGCNQDAIAEGASLGTRSAANYRNTSRGIAAMYGGISDGIARYRTSKSVAEANADLNDAITKINDSATGA